MRRERFLETFLVALGAREIIWTSQNQDSISGNILFDLKNSEERQAFIWHRDLITFLTANQLLDGDKVKFPIKEIDIPNCDNETKEILFNTLFNVRVHMIDKGIGSDFFCIHD
jgi:hypothetical protein